MTSTSSRPRGRPRHFEEQTVLDELTATFRSKGYGPTSLADLVDSSGVHRPSLYRTFGAKEELFARILRRYLTDRMDMFTALIDRTEPGIEGIHTFLELIRQDTISGTGQQGCLLVTTSTELCGTTPGFKNFGLEYRKQLRDRVRTLIRRAEPETGTDNTTTDQRTDLFVTFLLGLDVTTRGGADAEEIGRLIDAMHATVNTWRP
jgi:AcrR family transcriptional regulator